MSEQNSSSYKIWDPFSVTGWLVLPPDPMHSRETEPGVQPQAVQKSTGWGCFSSKMLTGALPLITGGDNGSCHSPSGQYVPDIPNAACSQGCALQRDQPPPEFCSPTSRPSTLSLSPAPGLGCFTWLTVEIQDEDCAWNPRMLPAQPSLKFGEGVSSRL